MAIPAKVRKAASIHSLRLEAAVPKQRDKEKPDDLSANDHADDDQNNSKAMYLAGLSLIADEHAA